MGIEFDALIEGVRPELEAMHCAREKGLSTCRQIIQNASKSIRAGHRREFDKAREFLQASGEAVASAREVLAGFPSLLHKGFFDDALKEYVEAFAFLQMVEEHRLVSADELKVGAVPYLHGMAEAASELRRTCLDTMRHGSFDEAQALFDLMDQVYEGLITCDFPDGMTDGLRRTTDALRAVVERTRSDLTQSLTQHELVIELRRATHKEG